MPASLVQPAVYSVVRGISRSRVRRAEKAELEEQEDDVWIKLFSFAPSFKQYRDY